MFWESIKINKWSIGNKVEYMDLEIFKGSRFLLVENWTKNCTRRKKINFFIHCITAGTQHTKSKTMSIFWESFDILPVCSQIELKLSSQIELNCFCQKNLLISYNYRWFQSICWREPGFHVGSPVSGRGNRRFGPNDRRPSEHISIQTGSWCQTEQQVQLLKIFFFIIIFVRFVHPLQFQLN